MTAANDLIVATRNDARAQLARHLWRADGRSAEAWDALANDPERDHVHDRWLQMADAALDAIPAPNATRRLEWSVEVRRFDGTISHTPPDENGDHIAFSAESMAYHLSTLNEPTRRAHGVFTAVRVRREVQTLADGTLVIRPWLHHCANCEGVDPDSCAYNPTTVPVQGGTGA